MNNRYFVIFKCREKMRIKTYEFKTRSDALNYFRLFMNQIQKLSTIPLVCLNLTHIKR